MVRATLRDIGYREIAAKFRTVNPFQSVSLAECVRGPATSRETTFFRRLSERISAMHAVKVQHFHFHDLHPCVRQLLEEDHPSQWWGRPLMRARIVAFIREQVLIIPKKVIPRVGAADLADAELLGKLLLAAGQIAKSLNIYETGFRLVINHGHDGGETIPHLHVHLLGGRELGWPPG